MANKYTYENWWNGEVILIYASTVKNKSIDLKIADWFEFLETDIQKIKVKQQVIFKDKVNALLNKFIDEFKKRFDTSEMKRQLLSDEIEQCKEIMFGKIPDSNLVFLNHWNFNLEFQYISDIQLYIKRTIKDGIDEVLWFIHSPYCVYQDKNSIDSRIYARFVWEYHKWLKSFALKLNKELKKNNTKDPKESRLWFKVGILFANGDMDKLLIKHKVGTMANYSAIASELGDKSLRPYISQSLSFSNSTDKNIFSKKAKIDYIISYCKSKSITVVDSFYKRVESTLLT